MKRYIRDRRIAGGKLETAITVRALRRAKEFGLLTTFEVIIKESQRLDHLAHEHLGNAQFWWVLAALSDIGWGMQVPPGTIIRVPNDIGAVKTIVG